MTGVFWTCTYTKEYGFKVNVSILFRFLRGSIRIQDGQPISKVYSLKKHAKDVILTNTILQTICVILVNI